MKSPYIPLAFAVFGIMCGIFGFFTELYDEKLVVSSFFFLQMSAVSFLAAIYFEVRRKN